MTYRITGGLGLFTLGLSMLGVAMPAVVIAILLTVAGVALLAGI